MLGFPYLAPFKKKKKILVKATLVENGPLVRDL
jgi:hypothetical protein